MLIAGVDEVGRGPLAGPVLASAVILPEQYSLEKLTDSKKLSEKKRIHLYHLIQQQAIAVAIGMASVKEIDSMNILNASLLAMKRAVENLNVKPEKVLVDGVHCPKISIPSLAIIKGDEKEPAISAASIIAKVYRDKMMTLFEKSYPEYGFSQHKGYGTKLHLTALQKFGATLIHRKSFSPVQQRISQT